MPEKYTINESISPTDMAATYPQVAVDDNDNAVLLWRGVDKSTDTDNDIKQLFLAEYRDSAWTYPTSADDAINPGVAYAYVPQVACNSRSSSVIVWQQSDGTYYQIFVSTRIVPIPVEEKPGDDDSGGTPTAIPFPGTLGFLMLLLGLLGAHGADKTSLKFSPHTLVPDSQDSGWRKGPTQSQYIFLQTGLHRLVSSIPYQAHSFHGFRQYRWDVSMRIPLLYIQTWRFP